ncbi:MAG: S8 family serine peptidase, partial [Anaerolineales bacterium]
ACYQWFVAPTRTDGSDPRPDLAPDVINNSWSCPDYEGCTEPDILLAVVQAVRAAGILTAHSAGNDGRGDTDLSCETIHEPAAIYAESFTVGSTTESDHISYFSSRGPVTIDGSNRFKPQITAPGSSIYSTIPNSSYGFKSGTSMAAPHVAGLVALLISAQPALAGQVDELGTLIERSALPLFTEQSCGGDTPTSHPNHTYGWGRIDAWAAYQDSVPGLILTKTAPDTILPNDILTYTITVTNSHSFLGTHNVILTDTIPEQSAFSSATGNYSVNGRLVTWQLGDIPAGHIKQVELAVYIPEASTGTITNDTYEVFSDEVTTPVTGTAVNTRIQLPAISWSTSESCQDQWLVPGIIFTCQASLHNTGNYTDTFTINATSIDHEVIISPTVTTLGSTQYEDISIMIKVPMDAPAGEKITSIVTATSTADSKVSESLEIASRVSFRQILPIIYHNP